MRCACVDIGSNTTRLLVADVAGARVDPVVEQRAFTHLGQACREGAAAAPETVSAVAAVVAEQARAAREAGASALRVVATAALRRLADGAAVCAAVGAAAGARVELLSEREEAQLAFAGATAACADAAPDELVAVADVGGGSSELIVGTRAGGVRWLRSLPLGSGDLAAARLRADPPTAAQLAAVRADVAAALAHAAPPHPRPARALAVGGSATSLRRLAGPRLDAAALDAAAAALVAAPAAVAAERHGLDPARVRLLRAAILVLAGVAELLGPLTVACGGLREGVVMALAAEP